MFPEEVTPQIENENMNTKNYQNFHPAIHEKKKDMSLWDYSRCYQIGGISIIDFIVVYLILYFINISYLHLHFGFILALTFPITIIYHMIATHKMNFVFLCITIAFLVSFVAYFLCHKKKKY
jgi:hypothetical protein